MRARIRHQLLPLLRRDFEPSTVTRLARLASLAREEETFWRALEEERFAALAAREASGSDFAEDRGPAFAASASWLARGAAAGRASESPPASTLALTRRLVRRIVC